MHTPRTGRGPAAALATTLGLVLLGACTSEGDPAPTGPPAASSASSPSPAQTTSAAPSPAPTPDPTPADGGPDAPGAGGSATPVPGDVQPIVSVATVVGDEVELAGYVAGVVVDEGVCRFELVGGGTTVRAESTAMADASVTVCAAVTVAAPAGAPGTWRARLVWVPTGAVSADVPVTVG